MKSYDACTPQEINDYNIAQQDTADTYTRGIGKLIQRNNDSTTPENERGENNEKIADLKADRGIVRACRGAFYAKRAQIEPPTQEQLKSLKENLDEVNSLAAGRKIVSDVVDLANNAMKTFMSIQPNS